VSSNVESGLSTDAGKSCRGVFDVSRADKGLVNEAVVAGAVFGIGSGGEDVFGTRSGGEDVRLIGQASLGGCMVSAKGRPPPLACAPPQVICVIGGMLLSKVVSVSGPTGGLLYFVFVIFPDTWYRRCARGDLTCNSPSSGWDKMSCSAPLRVRLCRAPMPPLRGTLLRENLASSRSQLSLAMTSFTRSSWALHFRAYLTCVLISCESKRP
jgi:hypothetical protein